MSEAATTASAHVSCSLQRQIKFVCLGLAAAQTCQNASMMRQPSLPPLVDTALALLLLSGRVGQTIRLKGLLEGSSSGSAEVSCRQPASEAHEGGLSLNTVGLPHAAPTCK